MSRTFRNLILLLGVVLGFCGRAFAAPTPIGSVTITGAEQSSGGVRDTGPSQPRSTGSLCRLPTISIPPRQA